MTLHPDRRRLIVDADEEYGAQLRLARLQVGLTQDQLAERAGLSDGSSVARIETGKRRPRLATQQRLAKAIEELQEVSVKPRMYHLIMRLVEFDAQVQAAGTELPAVWAQIREQIQAEAALLQAPDGRVVKLRPQLRILDRI